jgi:spectinomycin phosphotransferase
MLAALHLATPAAAGAPSCELSLPQRGALGAALRELDRPWHGGPFAERARSLLTEGAAQLHRQLEIFDELSARVAAARREPVITHGEPHPANVMRVGTERLLVDWDTVGLAPPERDLWLVVSDTGQEIDRYAGATGRPVDPAALALYRLRWALNDFCSFMAQLRSEHRRGADTEHAWQALKITMQLLAQ